MLRDENSGWKISEPRQKRESRNLQVICSPKKKLHLASCELRAKHLVLRQTYSRVGRSSAKEQALCRVFPNGNSAH